ncbi:MAG: hypothetical protein KJZ65_05940 [Phycisphaerales bacterium]|nr:hypothetical protein [Phycisphaerales bacterium]
MKRRAIISFVLATSLPVSAALPGPLTPPPGAISPTGKPLTEIEPRIAINATNTPGDATTLFKITAPGSYYLTGDIVGVSGKHGIRIDADDVTIDFNGFTLRGPGSGVGLIDRDTEQQPSIKNITLRNGTVTGWNYGLSMPYCQSARVEHMNFASNALYGTTMNGALVAIGCTLSGSTYVGLENQGDGVVINCLASGNGTGISLDSGLIADCFARGNEYGFAMAQGVVRESLATGSTSAGIELIGRAAAVDCRVTSGGRGVEIVGHGAVVEGCSITSASDHGIMVGFNDARVVGNSITYCGSSSSHSAIHVNSGVQRAHIEGNSSWDCYRGIIAEGTQCMIVGNRVGRLRGPYNTYYAVPGNVVGPIVTAGTNAGTVSVLTGSPNYVASFAATDPHTNISC